MHRVFSFFETLITKPHSGTLTYTMRSLNTQLCQGPCWDRELLEKIAIGRLFLEPLWGEQTQSPIPDGNRSGKKKIQ